MIIKSNRLTIIIIIFFFTPLYAGPPFLTDNPDVLAYQQTDFYLYSQTTNNAAGTFIQAPALEMDWGFAPNWQLSIYVPYAMWFPPSQPNNYGLGDTYLQAEYRFAKESKYLPGIAIEPQISFATGNVDKSLGYGTSTYQIPIWLEKTFGSWVIDTGGGININPAKGYNNNGFAGLLLQKNLTEQLTLGGEIFHQSAASSSIEGYGAYTVLNAGLTYNLTPNFSFLCSVGNSIAGDENFISYVGFLWETGKT